jgi:glycosyltransferase involved in cell wall biosynthesis
MADVKVFMISRDARALDPVSDTADRLRSYEAAGAKIAVAVFGLRRVPKILRDARVVGRDWVVTSQDPFEAGILAWWIARLAGARLEIQLHGDFFGPYWRREAWHRPFRLRIAAWLLTQADAVRVPSARVAASIREFVPEQKIARIPVAPRDGAFVRGPRAPRPTILYLGRMSREKNLLMLVEAFEKVLGYFPNAVLVLGGNGPEEETLRPWAKRINQKFGEDAVHFRDWDSTPPGSLVSEAWACALPSNHESWSRFIVEAANAGCPVVMTDVGAAGEVIRDGESGWVAPVGDKDAFAAALIEALTNRTEAERRAENAKRAAERLPKRSEIAELIVRSWKEMRL